LLFFLPKWFFLLVFSFFYEIIIFLTIKKVFLKKKKKKTLEILKLSFTFDHFHCVIFSTHVIGAVTGGTRSFLSTYTNIARKKTFEELRKLFFSMVVYQRESTPIFRSFGSEIKQEFRTRMTSNIDLLLPEIIVETLKAYLRSLVSLCSFTFFLWLGKITL